MNELTPAEFAALMQPGEPWHQARKLAVAVSGGADSMALAYLVRGWGRPHAFIVDHGLRPGSAQEARLTAGRLDQMAIPATILTLRNLRRTAQAARQARYAALMAACVEAGLADLLIAQHALDQAETVQLREASGTGEAGRAGMACLGFQGPVRLIRPLLSVPPARLRATLLAAGVVWVEDPSNQDLRTPRARLRQAKQDSTETLARARVAGAARAAAERAIAAELASQVSLYPEGYAIAEGPLSSGALSALIWTLSGRPHPPAAASVARLVPLRTGTLHGVQIARSRTKWLLAREPAAQPARTESPRWDRFRASAASDVARPRRQPALVTSGAPGLGWWFDPPRPAAPAPFAIQPSGWGCTPALPALCLTRQAASAHTGPGTGSPGSLQPRPEPGELDWIAGII